MKYLLILVIVMGLLGCSDRSMNQIQTLDDPEPVEVNQEELECFPIKISKGSNLTVRLPDNHGSNFLIQNPEGLVFFLTSARPDRKMFNQNLIDGEVFRRLKELNIIIDTLRAIPYVYGADSLVRVFDSEGTYTLRVGDNLETSGDFKHFACQVEYSGS